MTHRATSLLSWALSLCVVAAAPHAQGYINHDRWGVTSTNGPTGPMGTPITLTWSIAPDDTLIPPSTPSNLISFLDGLIGAGQGGADLTQRPWFPIFQQSFDRLSELGGVTYIYQANDDGHFFTSGFSGVGGPARGDVRIAGKPYSSGEANVLAQNFYPDYGDMMINTNQGTFFSNQTNNYRFLRNTLMHELMHGLGVDHIESSSSRFLLEPTLSTAFDGPQLDDILALHRLYGDAYEKNGGNDTVGQATPLGGLAAGASLQKGTLGDNTVVAATAVDFVSIDDNSDVDYFSFTLASPLDVSLALTPKGANYQIGPDLTPTNDIETQEPYNSKSLSNLSLALYASNGTTQLGEANLNGAGVGESVLKSLGPGTYYARVTGSDNDVQLYNIAVTASPTGPADLRWSGRESGAWDAWQTANFELAAAPAGFRGGDNVMFDAAASVTTVNLPGAVEAGTVAFTGGNYRLEGPGGFSFDTLTVSGSIVELASEANSYGGEMAVYSGELQLAGSGPLAGHATVRHGGTLNLNGDYQFTESSRLDGDGHVRGVVSTAGTVAPGRDIGTLTLVDDFVLEASSVLEMQLAGTLAGISHDRLNVEGAATLGGTLAVSLVNGFMPPLGSVFTLMTAGQMDGGFAEVVLPELAGGMAWQVSYLQNQISLAVSSSVVIDPADFNNDGSVDGGDLAVWRNGFGAVGSATRGDGDADENQSVDGFDFLTWQRSLTGPAAVESFSTSVPEPTGMAMAVAAIAVWRLRQRLPR